MQGLCTVQEEGPAEFRYLAHFMATQTLLTLTGFAKQSSNLVHWSSLSAGHPDWEFLFQLGIILFNPHGGWRRILNVHIYISYPFTYLINMRCLHILPCMKFVKQ